MRRAAQQRLPKAKHNLGVLALQDDNIPEACAWFEAASKDGWLNSTFALGALYLEAGKIDVRCARWSPRRDRAILKRRKRWDASTSSAKPMRTT